MPERHRDELAAEWAKSDWSETQDNVDLTRIETLLIPSPVAIGQPHERIIGQAVSDERGQKFSLYEPHASLIVRGKGRVNVAFGRPLFLTEVGFG